MLDLYDFKIQRAEKKWQATHYTWRLNTCPRILWVVSGIIILFTISGFVLTFTVCPVHDRVLGIWIVCSNFPVVYHSSNNLVGNANRRRGISSLCIVLQLSLEVFFPTRFLEQTQSRILTTRQRCVNRAQCSNAYHE